MRVFKQVAKMASPVTRRLKLVSYSNTGRTWVAGNKNRLALFGLVSIIVFSVVYSPLSLFTKQIRYKINPKTETLLSEVQPRYAQYFDSGLGSSSLDYNQGYQPGGDVVSQNASSKFSARFFKDPNQGTEVTDVVNKVTLKLKPLFDLGSPEQQHNRVVYPLIKQEGFKVISIGATGYKEDILLEKFAGDALEFKYKLELPEGTEARLENDGSLGVYGAESVLLGDIQTGSEKDVELLEKARKNAEKVQLLFSAPAPFIVEYNGKTSDAKAWYKLEDDVLTVHTQKLDTANYPISIDPSIYIETARKLMRGNNESNIDFDVPNELIQKGKTTGGRFDDWGSTKSLNNNNWAAGTAAAGGFVYSVGGGMADDTLFATPGTTTFTVPAGVSSISIKGWGAGGGGGGSAEDRAGGAGGGGGYAAATVTVTAGEVLTVYVGEGGKAGRFSDPNPITQGDAGGGGGFSGLFRGTTPLLIAGAGGGGGGANGDTNSASRAAGAAGGAGGGSSGVAGTTSGSTIGGGAGTSSAGGAAGASTTSGGTAGASLQGGQGASSVSKYSLLSLNGGGKGGQGETGATSANRLAGGGGGGGGYYGGGGGGRTAANFNGGAGGGGGSGYVTGTSTSNTAGSGINPGNAGDSDRNDVGDGGAGGAVGPFDGTEGDDGSVLITVASNETVATSSVYWAQFSTSNQNVESPNPGAGVCSSWCTLSNYNLPNPRVGLSLVAYNGFLYAIGGANASGTRQSTVYIAKLGANGEPSLWHPTDSVKSNWVYWYPSTSTLSTERSYAAATVSNNRLYLLGGQTTAATGGVTTVEYADINPTGDITTWSSTGMVALPSARHGHSTEVYNGHMYLIGGTSSGTIQSGVSYINVANSGAMSGSWVATTTMSTAKTTWGGSFSTIWGGYLYVAGGCTAINGSGFCTNVTNDIQLASINADGSISSWATMLGVNSQRFGYGLVAWRDALYGIGGCRKQNTTTGACEWGVANTTYGDINQDGDASTISDSKLSGTAPCSGATPTNCHIPPEGTGNGQAGNMSGGAVINNGIIYYFGGCTAVANGTICYVGNSAKATDNVIYSAISDDGVLTRVASCSGSSQQFYGNWCVDNGTNVIPSNLAGFGIALFNNVVYLIGGTTGTEFTSNVYYNPLNADGSLGTWGTQTFADLDVGTARGYMYAFTRANPSAASTYPGNLYVLGGCAPNPVDANGVDCGATQFTTVYKCNITTSGALEIADTDDCTTTGQLQIDAEPGTGGNQGLGVMAGAVYANYIYLIGGQSPNEAERGTIMYAKIDNSNNIVATTGGIWQTSANTINPVRRRGTAFGYNGYLYALAGYNSGETLNDLLYAKIDVSNGSIGTFTESTVKVIPRWDSASIVNNGFVYTLGGCSFGVPPQDCVRMNRTVQSFQLYNNYSGSPKSYAASAALFTTDRIAASTAILGGYIYVAGGCTGTSECSTVLDNTQYASVSANGTVGTWNNTTDSTLPNVRAWGQLEVAGGTLYYIGGHGTLSTDESADVYYATPTGSGDITTWATATNGLPAARSGLGATVWNDRIYTVGGTDSGATRTTTVYVSPQLNSGGNITSAWSSSISFNVARSGATAIAYANNLYLLGGFDGTNYLSDVQYTQINSDGTVDSWNYTTSLPSPIRQADGFAVNGYMYLIGGRTAATVCAPNTLVTPISANTTIATGNDPTGVGQWYETNVNYTGARYGAAVAYAKGVAYILGGACGASLAYTNATRVVQSTIQAQPQIARYSRMIDTDSDVFPTNWLLNGLDNSIGARWKVKYKSSTNANNSWGQETDFGAVTLGTPETYTPLNGAGTDTEFARFFYFSISIDSSLAYGYPDDVTRGPTIDDLTLFFTSDPNKRLRHGKTFTGGEEQPLDTPF